MASNNGSDRSETVKNSVRDYYGTELKSNKDLKTNACCCGNNSMKGFENILSLIDDEILDRFYGCGSPIPPLLDGLTVLDLGSGTGRDVYIASKLVGPNGRVIGIDMTLEQLEIANRHVKSQMEKFGYLEPNVEFKQGFIEDLKSLGIEDGSVDVVISNCVINLSPEKEKVFSEIFRVLKKGGELYFSDVFADRRVPDSARSDPVLVGECLGGAMYVGDFRRLMQKVGFTYLEYVSVSDLSIENEGIRKALSPIGFTSRTVRAFKLDDLEDACEDYGQVAAYKGNIPGHSEYFDLDSHHRFYTNEVRSICGNTASILKNTRYASAFTVIGNREIHQGQFECDDEDDDKGPRSGCCCCC